MALYFDTTTDAAGALRGDVQQAVAKATRIFAAWELSRFAASQDIAWSELDHETRDIAKDWDLDADSSRDLVDETVNDMVRSFKEGGITKTVRLDWDASFADAEPDSAEIMICGGGPTVTLAFDFGLHGTIDVDSLKLHHSWGTDSGVLTFDGAHAEAAAFVADCLCS